MSKLLLKKKLKRLREIVKGTAANLRDDAAEGRSTQSERTALDYAAGQVDEILEIFDEEFKNG